MQYKYSQLVPIAKVVQLKSIVTLADLTRKSSILDEDKTEYLLQSELPWPHFFQLWYLFGTLKTKDSKLILSLSIVNTKGLFSALYKILLNVVKEQPLGCKKSWNRICLKEVTGAN